MKQISDILWYVVICLLFSCCKSDETDAPLEPAITLETAPELIFDQGVKESMIRFTANAAWTATVPDAVRDWCQLSQASGEAGTVNLLVVLSENETPDDRNAKITICCGTALVTVLVVQKQKDALTVTTNRLEVEQAGGIVAIEVKSNVAYNWEMAMGMDSWVTRISAEEANAGGVSRSNILNRALKTETLYFRIAPNEDTDYRTGEIIFYATETDGFSLEECVAIYQHEKSVVLIAERQQNFSDAGGWVEAEISSNTEYEYKLPDVDWIRRDAGTRGMSSHTMYFEVLPNETYDSRQADIIFYKKGDVNVADTLHVTQAQKDGLILGTKEIKVTEEGAVVEVQVKANIKTELYVDSRYDWLQEVSTQPLHTRALTEGKFYLQVDANPSYDAREATIFVQGTGNSTLREELKIVQGQQRKLTVKIEYFGQLIDQNYFEVEPESGEIDFYFDTSVDYSVEITEDWLHQPADTRALKRDYLLLEIEAYTEFNQPDRAALVILKDKDSELADTVTVVQKTKIQRTYNVATAGSLLTLISDDEKLEIRSLILTGELNGTDLHLIREMAGRTDDDKSTKGKLTELDISAAKIVGGGEAYYARWGSGAAMPNPSTYWYTYDSGTYEEYLRGIARTNVYTEGIGPNMFKWCRLQKLALPGQIRLIGEDAFNSGKFTVLTLPETVGTIGKQAFANCVLSELHLKGAVPPVLDKDAFIGVKSLTVYVPSLSISRYKAADGWKELNIVGE